jgi:hypothetical protein
MCPLKADVVIFAGDSAEPTTLLQLVFVTIVAVIAESHSKQLARSRKTSELAIALAALRLCKKKRVGETPTFVDDRDS